MAEYLIQDTTLTAIANAVRSKTGKSESIKVSDLADKINGITSGGAANTDIEDALIDGSIGGVYRNDRVTKISNSCFYRSNVTEVYFPNVVTVASSAFSACKTLVKADFRVVESFESFVFNGATALQTLIVRTNKVATLGQVPFSADEEMFRIYVPAALVDSYKTATNWKSYADCIVAIEDYPEICG